VKGLPIVLDAVRRSTPGGGVTSSGLARTLDMRQTWVDRRLIHLRSRGLITGGIDEHTRSYVFKVVK